MKKTHVIVAVVVLVALFVLGLYYRQKTSTERREATVHIDYSKIDKAHCSCWAGGADGGHCEPTQACE